MRFVDNFLIDESGERHGHVLVRLNKLQAVQIGHVRVAVVERDSPNNAVEDNKGLNVADRDFEFNADQVALFTERLLGAQCTTAGADIYDLRISSPRTSRG